ncbi:MAG: stage III sporulation protein AF [Clostridia bacterium]|nr:stage III sporulation protein AF [Clostridia bacterium]
MTEIRSWAIMVCISLVISSVIMFISPEGNMNKYMGYIISVFILTVVLLPVTKMDFTFLSEWKTEEFMVVDEEYSVMLNEYIYEESRNVIEENIKKELDNICEEDFSVDIMIETNEETKLIVKKITIKINRNDMRKISDIRKITGELTGVVPEVKLYELQSNY